MSLDYSLGVGDGTASSSARNDRHRRAAFEADDAKATLSSSEPRVAPVRFVDADARERASSDAAATRSIVLRPRADSPGGLANGIDGDLESALALRGALPSGLLESATLEERLRDQLSRATCVPVKGVCLALPPLGACVELDGVLADVDARYLSAWLAAAAARPLPISILFDEQDRSLLARVPRSLGDVVADLRAGTLRRHVETNPKMATQSSQQIALFSDEHDSEVACVEDSEEGMSIPDFLGMELGVPMTSPSEAPVEADSGSPDSDGSWAEAAASSEAPEAPIETAEDREPTSTELQAPESHVVKGPLYRAKPPPPVFTRPRRTMEARPTAVAAETVAPVATRAPSPQRPAHKSLASAMSDTLRPPAHVAEHRVTTSNGSHAQEERIVVAAEWRAHAIELDAARGPKPVSAIERLYAERYLPLVGALARNEADHAIGSVVEQWSQAFAESYTESFSTLKVTGRRPTMVLDAFDVASRIARLASARSVKLLLVDSLSFDLAERVATRMKTALDKRAVLVERTTLWSALPTSTPTQMALLARGPDALRDAAPVSSSEPDISRGRNIGTLRRERVGSRELFKLDLVEARLRTPGAAYDERLDAIADEVTEVIVKFIETLPPRTLLYVFGDHGFVLGHGANGWATGPATQGGASPDEVLVAGHAWLADAMQ